MGTSSGNVTPGPPKAQSLARSELFGILGSIMHVNYICSRFDIQQGSVSLHCDNEGSIKAVRTQHSFIKNSRKNFDMFQSIHSALQLSPVQWSFHHIHGHQDDEYGFEALSRVQQLNVLADLKAKEMATNSIETGSLTQYRDRSLPYMLVEIKIADDRGKTSQASMLTASNHNQTTLFYI